MSDEILNLLLQLVALIYIMVMVAVDAAVLILILEGERL